MTKICFQWNLILRTQSRGGFRSSCRVKLFNLIIFHSNLWWTQRQFFTQQIRQSIDKQKANKNSLSVPFLLCSWEIPFFYRQFHTNKFSQIFIVSPSPFLSVLIVVCCLFSSVMNFIHFLWIVSHIFRSPSTSLSHRQQRVCMWIVVLWNANYIYRKEKEKKGGGEWKVMQKYDKWFAFICCVWWKMKSQNEAKRQKTELRRKA